MNRRQWGARARLGVCRKNNPLNSRQNHRNFADDIFRCILLNWYIAFGINFQWRVFVVVGLTRNRQWQSERTMAKSLIEVTWHSVTGHSEFFFFFFFLLIWYNRVDWHLQKITTCIYMVRLIYDTFMSIWYSLICLLISFFFINSLKNNKTVPIGSVGVRVSCIRYVNTMLLPVCLWKLCNFRWPGGLPDRCIDSLRQSDAYMRR